MDRNPYEPPREESREAEPERKSTGFVQRVVTLLFFVLLWSVAVSLIHGVFVWLFYTR